MGAMANTGYSWPWWQCAKQALPDGVTHSLTWCASLALVQATHQVLIFHFPKSHSYVPFELAWSKSCFYPPATPAPGMLYVIDSLVLQVL